MTSNWREPRASWQHIVMAVAALAVSGLQTTSAIEDSAAVQSANVELGVTASEPDATLCGAANVGQCLAIHLTASGIRLVSISEVEEYLDVSMRCGRPGGSEAQAVAVRTRGTEVAISMPKEIETWHRGGALGFEQGFKIAGPVKEWTGETASIGVALDLSGDLARRGVISEDARAAYFRDRNGVPRIRYSLVGATASSGEELPAKLSLDPGSLRVLFLADPGAFPVTVRLVIAAAFDPEEAPEIPPGEDLATLPKAREPRPMSPETAPANDTCAGETALVLDTIATGTNNGAINDYSLTGGTSCYSGLGQTTSSAAGRDTVWSFTAPATDTYSFRVIRDDPLGGGSTLVLYTAPTCPAAPAMVTCAAPVVAVNRQLGSSRWSDAEEVVCRSMTMGSTVHLFVDEASPTTTGGRYTVEVNKCASESEANGTPASADAFACGTEGVIDPPQEADFFALGSPPPGSRVFAVADTVSASSTDFDLRITNGTTTLEYDDLNNDAPWGSLGPNCAGTRVGGSDTYLRMSHFNSTVAAEPYRLYSVVQPPGNDPYQTSAAPETEPNGSAASANASGKLFFSGEVSASGDADFFRFCAKQGDLVFLSLDADPSLVLGDASSTSPFNSSVALYDGSGAQLMKADDPAATSSATSGAGGLTATTPSKPGEALTWRARYSGAYEASVQSASTGDYLLSISLNCLNGTDLRADLRASATASPNPVVAGADLTLTINVTNDGPEVALDAVLTNPIPANTFFASLMSPPGWSCTVPPVGGLGTVSCTTPCLVPGALQVFRLVVHVGNACAGAGTILHDTATVSSKLADPNAVNDSATLSAGVSGPPPQLNCNDQNTCTTDLCDPVSQQCVYAAITCLDGNPCTSDVCDPVAGCLSVPNDGNTCSDGNGCTVDACVGGNCVGTPLVCNDNNPCTDDACDTLTGCYFIPDDANACSDGNACTMEVCNNGQCVCPTCETVPVMSFVHTTPLPIPDYPGGPVTSTLLVSGAGPYLQDIDLKTFVVHPSSADLAMTLRSPSGTIVTITNRNGGPNANVFNGTLWDDQADPGSPLAAPWPYAVNPNIATDHGYSSNVTASPLVSQEPLDAFMGENPNGMWTLTLLDGAAGNVGTLNGWNLLVRSLPFAPPHSIVSVTNPTQLAIPDDGGAVTSTVTVAGAGGRIGRVRLTTFITHSWNHDLLFTLTSPAGTIATISTQNGDQVADVFHGTLWDDHADPASQIPYGAANPGIVTDHGYTSGQTATPLTPEESFSVFRGANPNGIWTLTVKDNEFLDTGSLDSWTLEITSDDCSGFCTTHCDDGSLCTVDSCDPSSGCVFAVVNCDDGNLCTLDQCSAEVGCAHIAACDDHNPCTDDSCNPATGACTSTPNANACDDGNACTTPDVCSGGQCVCGAVGSCTGTVTNYANTTPVTIPTGPAVVSSSITVAGAARFLERVRPTTTILHSNNGDLDVTLTSPAGTVVTITSDNGGTNDNVFNGTLWDDKANPTGQVPYSSNGHLVTDALTSNNVALTTAVIEEALGAFYGEDPNGIWILRVSDDTAANGGTLGSWGLELTTLSETPVSTTSTFTNQVPTVLSDNPAVSTSDLTVTGAGSEIGKIRLRTFLRHTFPADLDITLRSPGGTVVTVSTDNGGSADNVFNGTLWDDRADPGNQVPFPADTFAASNLVTDATYANNTVKTALVPEEALGAFEGEDPNGPWRITVYDDLSGNTGTLDSWSLEITTIHCSASCAVICSDDGNPCTVESCDPASGCVHLPGDFCDDANACTIDTCDPATAQCTYAPVNCDDGNTCTMDACNPAVGCVHDPLDCNDANACTQDLCDPLVGCQFSPSNCDDANPCTIDSCDLVAGCAHAPVPPVVEVSNVRAEKSGSLLVLRWDLPSFPATYEVVRGLLSALPVGPGGGDELCFAIALEDPSVLDSVRPAVGGGLWYLVRANYGCGLGPLGNQGLHGAPSTPRTTSTCP